MSNLYSEQSIIAIYRINDTSTTPFVIIESTLLEKEHGSKLLSMHFDLDTSLETNDTLLVVNARYENMSMVKKYVLQNMSIEVSDASRVHMKKTKIVLTGIDSMIEIQLSDIFKKNLSRLVFTWTIFLGSMIAIYVCGYLTIVRQFNEERPNRYTTVDSTGTTKSMMKVEGTREAQESKNEDLTLLA